VLILWAGSLLQSRTHTVGESYSAASAVLAVELLKGVLSIGFAWRSARHGTLETSQSTKHAGLYALQHSTATSIVRQVFSRDCWKLSIPAILYVSPVFLAFPTVPRSRASVRLLWFPRGLGSALPRLHGPCARPAHLPAPAPAPRSTVSFLPSALPSHSKKNQQSLDPYFHLVRNSARIHPRGQVIQNNVSGFGPHCDSVPSG